ncbi:FHA domain-containing protein [Planctomicrobium sp. SH664]|uniref:FHA domain-containing protein n=1 Tax=Planctomicrobium sp. SH664 TaxID=3448125 RepID=UPI003F5C9C01
MTAPLILEITSGKFKGRRVKLTDPEMIIGRGEEARIRIASSEVSREHCVLLPRTNAVLVRDLESRNGTFIDGRPLRRETLLLPGGQLTVGPLTFTLLGERSEPKTPRTDVNVLGKAAVTEPLSDDAIASWLTDELPANPTSDTAVLSGSRSTGDSGVGKPAGAAREVPPPPAALVAARRREFRTVEEEAKDIIRRHYEMVASENAALATESNAPS